MAKVGVPSFVVTLAGLLIFQGLILQILEVRGTILIQNKWINDTAYYFFSDDRRVDRRPDRLGPLRGR